MTPQDCSPTMNIAGRCVCWQTYSSLGIASGSRFHSGLCYNKSNAWCMLAGSHRARFLLKPSHIASQVVLRHTLPTQLSRPCQAVVLFVTIIDVGDGRRSRWLSMLARGMYRCRPVIGRDPARSLQAPLLSDLSSAWWRGLLFWRTSFGEK